MLIRHELPLGAPGISGNMCVYLDKAMYNGTVTMFFEFSFAVTNAQGSTGTMYLVNEATNTSYCTVAVSGAAMTRYRKAISASAPAGFYTTSWSGYTGSGKDAKVVILQDTGVDFITASALVMPMDTDVDGWLDTFPTGPSTKSISYWYFDATKWDGTVVCSLAVSGYTGNARAGLFVEVQEDDGTMQTWTAVLSYSTMSVSQVWEVAAATFTPVSGRHYRVIARSGSTRYYATFSSAVLIVKQTGVNITKLQEQFVIARSNDNYLPTSGLFGTSIQWKRTEWSGVTKVLEYQHIGLTNATTKPVNTTPDPDVDLVATAATGAYVSTLVAATEPPDLAVVDVAFVAATVQDMTCCMFVINVTVGEPVGGIDFEINIDGTILHVTKVQANMDGTIVTATKLQFNVDGTIKSLG